MYICIYIHMCIHTYIYTYPPGYKKQWVEAHVCRVQFAVPEAGNLQKWYPTSQPSHYKTGIQPHKIQEMLLLQKWNSGSRWLTCFHVNLNRSFAYLGSHFCRDALANHWLTFFFTTISPLLRPHAIPCTARLCSCDQPWDQHIQEWIYIYIYIMCIYIYKYICIYIFVFIELLIYLYNCWCMHICMLAI